MAKFCTKCGRPLAEGEVCNCQAEKQVEVTPEQPAPEMPQGQPNQGMPNQGMPNQGMPNQGMPNQGMPNQGMPNQGMPNQGMPYQGQPYQTVPPKQPSQAGIFFKNAFAGFLAILKQPVAMGKSFVQSMDYKMSALFILIQAILVALFGIICAGKLMTYTVNAVSSIASEIAGYGSMSGLLGSAVGSMIKIPYAKAFFGTLLMSIVFSVALAGIFLLGNMILKNQVNFQMMLCVVAVRSVLIAPVIVVAMIVSLINPMVGILVFFGANIWAIMVMAQIIPAYSEKAAQFMPLVLFIGQLLFLLIALFIMTKCTGFYTPDIDTSSLGEYGDLFEMFY